MSKRHSRAKLCYHMQENAIKQAKQNHVCRSRCTVVIHEVGDFFLRECVILFVKV
jgi:hypothetical protein